MSNDWFMWFWWAAGWHSQVHTAQFSYLAQFVPCYSLTGTPRSLSGFSPASGATGSHKKHSTLQLQKKKSGWLFAPTVNIGHTFQNSTVVMVRNFL